MAQLELDPRFVCPNQTAQIDFNRSQILRRSGKGKKWMEKGDFEVISFDRALSALLEDSYSYFGRYTDARGHELDSMVNRTLKKSLPFIQGEQGKFNSFGHFTDSLFRRILSRTSQGRYRHMHRKHVEVNASKKSPPSEERVTRRADGFQPSLFRLESNNKARTHVLTAHLIADLNNPDGALPDYILQLPAYTKRAVSLMVEQPDIRSEDVANVLVAERYGKFSPNTIRGWLKRVRDDSGALRETS